MYYKENIMQKLMPKDVPQNKILIHQHCLNIYFFAKKQIIFGKKYRWMISVFRNICTYILKYDLNSESLNQY